MHRRNSAPIVFSQPKRKQYGDFLHSEHRDCFREGVAKASSSGFNPEDTLARLVAICGVVNCVSRLEQAVSGDCPRFAVVNGARSDVWSTCVNALEGNRWQEQVELLGRASAVSKLRILL